MPAPLRVFLLGNPLGQGAGHVPGPGDSASGGGGFGQVWSWGVVVLRVNEVQEVSRCLRRIR